MINSVSPGSPVSELYLQQQQPTVPAHKAKAVSKPEKQDSVVLSKQAQAAVQEGHKHH